MKRLLKNAFIQLIESKIFNKERFLDYSSLDPFNGQKAACFGNLNPTFEICIIRRPPPGSGFFSNFAYVLVHSFIQHKKGRIPVVDMKSFPTLYNDPGRSQNAWELFFDQPFGVSLEEAYKSQRVFLNPENWPDEFPVQLSKLPAELKDFYFNHFKFRPEILSTFENLKSTFGQNALGVHFRGKEMNYAQGHPFGPTKKQMIALINSALDTGKFDQIFLVTESPDYLKAIKKSFGNLVFHSDALRSDVNQFNIYPRANHRYLLGKEILVDALLLSSCKGLICSESNVSEFAIFHRNTPFDFLYKIDNGRNSNHRIWALLKFPIKSTLPEFLGGFRKLG